MKNLINNSIILCLLLSLITSCDKDFLDRNDPGVLTFDKLYKTKEDFNAALGGCYQSIMNPATFNIYFGEITSDNVYISRFQPSGAWQDIEKFAVNAGNSSLNTYWANNYSTIQQVNLLIGKLANSVVTGNDKNLIEAEAKFLRAYSYFNLVRVFGGVPIYNKEVDDFNKIYDIPRSSAEEVLLFIISDLNEAKKIDSYRTANGLATAGGKASSVAAKTLLGKVYLWKRDFLNAETTLSDIVTTSGLKLEDLSVLYNPDMPLNKEIIFSINYERASNFTSPFVTISIPYNSPPGVYLNVTQRGGSGYFMIEPYVTQKFSPGDKRSTDLIRTLSFVNVGIADINIYSLKYIDPLTTFNYWSGSNTIILRYADVLLMYAEALNENGKTGLAYPYINLVRKRAGIADLDAGYSKKQMFEALADERQKEFLMEGDRWFDLIFRGMSFLKQEMNNSIPRSYLLQNRTLQVKDNNNLFPIPELQIQVKPVLQQNPGY